MRVRKGRRVLRKIWIGKGRMGQRVGRVGQWVGGVR